LKTHPEKDKATITVVIPTFNRAHLLSRAINSVERQSYPNWKLIIADNASTDGTASVVADAMRIDSRITYFRHAENIGMLANWAFAISKVKTPFFCILCDDDIVLPEYFQTTIEAMFDNEEIGLCFGSTAIVDNNGIRLGSAPTAMAFGYYTAGFGASAMVKAQHPASTGTLFRSSCVEAVGGFDQGSHFVADLDMMLRVALVYPIVYLEKEVAFYIDHSGNSFKDGSGWFPGLLNIFKNIKKFEISNQSQNPLVFQRLTHNAILLLTIQFIRHPIDTYKSTNLHMVFQCLQEGGQSIRMVLYHLPINIARACVSSLKRKCLSFYLSAKSDGRLGTHLRRHPRADDYF